jgi:hypothetical protein
MGGVPAVGLGFCRCWPFEPLDNQEEKYGEMHDAVKKQ